VKKRTKKLKVILKAKAISIPWQLYQLLVAALLLGLQPCKTSYNISHSGTSPGIYAKYTAIQHIPEKNNKK